MSKKNRALRNLNPYRVNIALQVQAKKHELAMQMVADRVQKDAEFAADVLKIGGEHLREDIKKTAQEMVDKHNAELARREETFIAAEPEACGCQTCHCNEPEQVPVELDGGGTILVDPNELPDAPRDGQ